MPEAPSDLEEAEKLASAHRECEDSWYSCPLSFEGCSNDGAPKCCTCGRDALVKRIAHALVARAEKATEKAAKVAESCWDKRIGEHHEGTCCGEDLAAAIRAANAPPSNWRSLMRPIKFRAWYGNAMWKVLDIHWSKIKEGKIASIAIAHTELAPTVRVSFDDVQLMQFTGLLDKNGKEIYEGDICRDSEGKLLVIRWDEHNVAFVAGSKWLEWLRGYGNSGNPSYARACEVIGNIYSNPELEKPDAV